MNRQEISQKNLIPNQVVNIVDTDWKYTFTGLLKYVDYQAKPKVEYKYRVVELGTLKVQVSLRAQHQII